MGFLNFILSAKGTWYFGCRQRTLTGYALALSWPQCACFQWGSEEHLGCAEVAVECPKVLKTILSGLQGEILTLFSLGVVRERVRSGVTVLSVMPPKCSSASSVLSHVP